MIEIFIIALFIIFKIKNINIQPLRKSQVINIAYYNLKVYWKKVLI